MEYEGWIKRLGLSFGVLVYRAVPQADVYNEKTSQAEIVGFIAT